MFGSFFPAPTSMLAHSSLPLLCRPSSIHTGRQTSQIFQHEFRSEKKPSYLYLCVCSWILVTKRRCDVPFVEAKPWGRTVYWSSSGSWDDADSNCDGPSSDSSSCCSSGSSLTTFWGHFLGRPRGLRSPAGSTFFSAVRGSLFLLPLGRPLGLFGVGGPTGSCCCLRGRPLPLRWGSETDRTVLGSGEGSLVPLSLMIESFTTSKHPTWGAAQRREGRNPRTRSS